MPIASAERPNVLLIMCDQLRADSLGCYGNPVVRTPAIDGLSRAGAVFDSAYTPSPVCVPARACLVTGNEPQTNACFDNESAMPDSRTVMQALTERGYRAHGIGKMHFTPDPLARRGFQTREIGEEFGSADSDDYLKFVRDNGFGFVEFPHGLRDEMYYVPQLSPVPENLHFSRWVADRSIEFLRSARPEEPFFLWSSFIAPHPPFAPPSPWHRLYEPSLMPGPWEPGGGDGLLTIHNRLQNRYKYRDGGKDRRLWQLIRAYYLASVSYLDFQVARILGELRASGRLDDTLVILTADHGELLGDYGCFGKRSFLDAAARVPLIISGPGFAAGRRTDVASLIDLYPTICEAAGGADEQSVDGVSLQQPNEGRTVYGQFQQGDLALYAAIDESFKYIWSEPDRREYLIDRVRDRPESRNLAYNVRMHNQLVKRRAAAVDHFSGLNGRDIAHQARNVVLPLGDAPSERFRDALGGLAVDPDAATLVVRGGSWAEAPEGYR